MKGLNEVMPSAWVHRTSLLILIRPAAGFPVCWTWSGCAFAAMAAAFSPDAINTMLINNDSILGFMIFLLVKCALFTAVLSRNPRGLAFDQQ
jgi:heme/copper-type cytochrome/quinol oxidase subunit 2